MNSTEKKDIEAVRSICYQDRMLSEVNLSDNAIAIFLTQITHILENREKYKPDVIERVRHFVDHFRSSLVFDQFRVDDLIEEILDEEEAELKRKISPPRKKEKDLIISDYNRKFFVVRGNDLGFYRSRLTLDLGGVFNSRLKGGPGIVFPIRGNKKQIVKDFIEKNELPISCFLKKKRKTIKYEKEYQTSKGPENEYDPLYIFYTSLYSQSNEKSPLAITWLTTRGVFEGKDRENLVKKYRILVKQGKTIPLR